MATYTVYNNGNTVATVEGWGSALEIAKREYANWPYANVWIEDSNGRTFRNI